MSSAIEQINTHLASLSFTEMVTLNEQIGIALRKLSGGVKPVATKAGKKSSKKGADASDSDGEAKPKRKAAAGTLAWTAFVKHIKATQPEAFADVKKEAEKLTVVKSIRAKNIAAYDSFVAEWKEKYAAAEKSDASSVAEEAEEAEAVPAPVPYSDWAAPAKPKTAAEKLAEVKAAKAAEKAAKEAAASAPAPAATVHTISKSIRITRIIPPVFWVWVQVGVGPEPVG